MNECLNTDGCDRLASMSATDDAWERLRPNLVTTNGYDSDGQLVASRTGFYLCTNLIILGLFLDDADRVRKIRVFNSQDEEITWDLVARDDTTDVHLACVENAEDIRVGFQ